MNKSPAIKYILGALAFLVIASAILWYSGFFLFFINNKLIQDQHVDIINGENDTHNNTNQEADSVGKTPAPQFPDEFDILKKNNEDLSVNLQETYTKNFSIIVDRVERGSSTASDWISLGNIKYAFMDYPGAESAWLYAIQLNPLAEGAYANLAQLYWHKMPDYPKAEAMFLKLTEMGAAYGAATYKDLSDLYRYDYTEKSDFADDILLKGFSVYPDNYGFLSSLARYYLETGDNERAVQYYKRVLEVDPDNESAKEELSLLLNL